MTDTRAEERTRKRPKARTVEVAMNLGPGSELGHPRDPGDEKALVPEEPGAPSPAPAPATPPLEAKTAKKTTVRKPRAKK